MSLSGVLGRILLERVVKQRSSWFFRDVLILPSEDPFFGKV